jgi:hypothetical protein
MSFGGVPGALFARVLSSDNADETEKEGQRVVWAVGVGKVGWWVGAVVCVLVWVGLGLLLQVNQRLGQIDTLAGACAGLWEGVEAGGAAAGAGAGRGVGGTGGGVRGGGGDGSQGVAASASLSLLEMKMQMWQMLVDDAVSSRAKRQGLGFRVEGLASRV